MISGSHFTPLPGCSFIFPSRYLFAIGLPVVFSLGWGLPPASGCTLKQPDSQELVDHPGPGKGYWTQPARDLRDSHSLWWDIPVPLQTRAEPGLPWLRFNALRGWATPGSLAVTKGILRVLLLVGRTSCARGSFSDPQETSLSPPLG
eukprot:12008060-Prorocentrum_lima.AAC.4